MVDYVRTRAVKEAVEARLLGYPGVHAVAIGPKITGGQRGFLRLARLAAHP
jgi:hypothetical protein